MRVAVVTGSAGLIGAETVRFFLIKISIQSDWAKGRIAYSKSCDFEISSYDNNQLKMRNQYET